MSPMGTGLDERLRAEWQRDLARWKAPDDYVDQTFDDLAERYGEPHRHYHTLEHVAAVLRCAQSLDDLAREPEAVRMAAWYHDVVYDPTAADNEARSAVLAAAHLTALSVPRDIVQESTRLIELTAGHDAEPGDRNGAVLLDADLSILAAAPDRYERYTEGIRAEYAHVDDATFRSGRASVLEGFLARPYIFHTHAFRAEREARARANLERELADLNG
jgi:predicted metal-dependent HD superfamily phosphohydrolase